MKSVDDQRPLRQRFREAFPGYIYIIAGSFITACGLVFFINPGKIAAGGVSGIATILFHTVGWDPGLMIFVLSVPIFTAGVAIFGKIYGFKSFLGTVLLSGFTSLLIKLFGPQGFLDYNDSLSVLLSAIFGGVVTGIGMGLVMRSGANTGGTDIIAQIIARFTPMTLGSSLAMVDGVIIFSSIFVFGVTNAMYAIITVYITGLMIDKVVLSLGKNYAKTVFIVCSQNRDAIQSGILENLGHGGTILAGTGMFSGESRPVIMTVIKNNKINQLTKIVHNADPRAFMVVSDAYNVIGEGFKTVSSLDIE
ncbi:MAG: YitT family protein [Sphaerochaetaceae bacterium]